jgi:hypothetical protein
VNECHIFKIILRDGQPKDIGRVSLKSTPNSSLQMMKNTSLVLLDFLVNFLSFPFVRKNSKAKKDNKDV